MTRRRKAIFVIFFITIAVLTMATRFAAPIARPALGFVAKGLCSDVFVGGVTPQQAKGDLPDEPIARLIRIRIDNDTRSVRASIPLVATRTAIYRNGTGCTLQPGSGDLIALPTFRPSPNAAAHSAPPGRSITTDADTALFRVIDEAFTEPDPAKRRDTRAIVILHHGLIIGERYASGYTAENRFTGWSMTKSVTSALTGILVGMGKLSLDQDSLREEWRSDARSAITLDDLLHMSSGLDFDESYTPSGGATRMLFDAFDAAAVAAASPLAQPPGTHWEYSSATTNIISRLIRDAIGNDAEYAAFPRRALFDRIGMTSAIFEPDPSGTFVGSSFLYATARDWARFGMLYLEDGVWNGQRILPEGWVQYSVTPAPAAPLGKYGAQWWLNSGLPADTTQREWPALPRDIYWASGFNGQYVVVIPSRDLVVVRLGDTGGNAAWKLDDFLAGVLHAIEARVAGSHSPPAG